MNQTNYLTPEITEIGVNLASTKQGTLTWGTRAYLLHNPATGRLLLIDTGSAGSKTAIIQAIHSLGRQLSDLEAIILTHWHEDHSGSLGAIMDAAGNHIRILVPAGEINILREQTPFPLKSWGWIGRSGARPYSPGVLTADQAGQLELLHKDEPLLAAWDLQLLNTPGHSEAHISLLSPKRRTLFAGDALLCYKRTVFTFPHADLAKTEESARRLLALDFDYLLPGHAHAMPYRLSPADRQPITKIGPGWRLLEKALMIRPLARTTGPKLITAPLSSANRQKQWLITSILAGLLGAALFVYLKRKT